MFFFFVPCNYVFIHQLIIERVHACFSCVFHFGTASTIKSNHSCLTLYLLTCSCLQLFFQLSLLLSEGYQCITYAISLFLQLLFFSEVAFGIFFCSRFPIPPVLAGIWMRAKVKGQMYRGYGNKTKPSHGSLSA